VRCRKSGAYSAMHSIQLRIWCDRRVAVSFPWGAVIAEKIVVLLYISSSCLDQPAMALAPNKRPIYPSAPRYYRLAPVNDSARIILRRLRGKTLSTQSGLSTVVACQNLTFFVASKA
jgi:hypothetical protein